jgi:hypothetical protein
MSLGNYLDTQEVNGTKKNAITKKYPRQDP